MERKNRPGTGRAVPDPRSNPRIAALLVIALISFIVGVISGCPGSPNRDAAERFVEAWSEGNYSEMHSELSTASRRAVPLERFIARIGESEAFGTVQSLEGDDAEGDEEVALVPMTIRTRAFGTIEQPLRVEFGVDGIAWQPSLLFPGLRAGEELVRETEFEERAPILARDGQEMASGPAEAREYPLGSAMVDITGITATAGDDLDTELISQGVDPGDSSGASGLELAYNGRLSGKPGGTLSAAPIDGDAEARLLGEGEPKGAKPLKTTIDPEIQEAAVANLSAYVGGAAVLDVGTGEIRGIAGAAWSVLRPPGSTFKIITATAALKTGKATIDSEYEYATAGIADGREISNAGDKLCGGDFTQVFADSCNSVFAPLGEEVGEEALSGTAEEFGFNKPPAVFDETGTELIDPPTPTIPKPGEFESDLGVSSIGQGLVQATPLLMASVAQGIANRGVVLPTPVVTEKALQAERDPIRVASPAVARDMTGVMVAVVTSGTGYAAAISEGQVAGKTGTAEIGPRGDGSEQLIEDAWFAGFAPADDPELAVAVMTNDVTGGGGAVAAPIAGAILSAGL
ncbi:MAG: penicillin-binding transpeptidase domain-containing protein [Solirubrobacterales bacterium]